MAFVVAQPYGFTFLKERRICTALRMRTFVHVDISYRVHMNQSVLDKLHDRSLVAAVTHDNTRIWLLNEDGDEPVCVVSRDEPDTRHVRSAQERHGHASELAEVPYFTELAAVLSVASNVVLVGHGTGKANTVNRFLDHLETHREALRERIAATGKANVTAMTGAQIIQEARRKWSQAEH